MTRRGTGAGVGMHDVGPAVGQVAAAGLRAQHREVRAAQAAKPRVRTRR